MNLTTKKRLNDGREMPLFGLGVFRSKDGEETYNAVRYALDAGYRHIDTAAVYGNEASVGRAIHDSGIPREEIWITTKLWNDEIRAHNEEAALQASLKRLGTDYVDLYLIHWPVREEQGYLRADSFNVVLGKGYRKNIRLREVAVIVRVLLAAHGACRSRHIVKTSCFLLNSAAAVYNLRLSFNLVFNRTLNCTEGVKVFNLRSFAENIAAMLLYRDINVRAD